MYYLLSIRAAQAAHALTTALINTKILILADSYDWYMYLMVAAQAAQLWAAHWFSSCANIAKNQ